MKKNNLFSISSSFLCLFLFFGTVLSCSSDPASVKKPRPEKGRAKVYSKDGILEEILQALRAGNYYEALAHFEAFNAEDRHSIDILIVEASVLVSAERLEEARSVAEQILEQEEENIDALQILAMLSLARGDTTAYQKSLEQIVAKHPKHSDSLTELGNIAWSKKIIKLADEYWTKSLNVDPNNLGALMGKAQLRMRADEPEKAEKYLDTAIAQWPNSPEPLALRARLYKKYDLYRDALADQIKAVLLEPDNYWYVLDKARILIDLGRKAEALEDLKKASQLDPENFLTYVYSAGIQDELGNIKEAENDNLKLISLRPDYYFSYEALGIFALLEKKPEKAATYFIQAFARAPQNGNYALLAGLSLRMAKKDSQAKDFLTNAIKKVGKDKLEWQLLRLFLDMSGDTDIAIRIDKEKSNETKARMLYYLAQYYALKGNVSLAQKYHLMCKDLAVQYIIEWRLNEWALSGYEAEN